ncbi:MAG: PAC2 family protein [Candidatus Marsarchaeota archaeon]|nr:PAC2 family protein [Candidatus Marsarchaeota archaeon]MCL5102294.1 PAC2 family protein [Candidatus Marsarchaeota archaeon]
MLDIKVISQKKLDGYTLIEGFPGVGLVGSMALSYIIEKLGMEYYGYFDSQAFPPLVSIHNSIPMHPVRIYFSSKYKLVAIFAEFAVPTEMTYIMAKKISDFIKENKIKEVVSIGGMPSPAETAALEDPDSKLQNSPENQPETVYAVVSSPEMVPEMKKAGINVISEGVATGISALLMINSASENIHDTNLLVQVDQRIVDPKYAEIAIKAINKMLDLKIDITELDKEAKIIEAKVRDIIKKNKASHESLKAANEDAGPSMYA